MARQALVVLAAAATASALLTGPAPALRRIAQPRSAVPVLQAEVAPVGEGEEVPGTSVQDQVAESLKGVVVPTNAPVTTPQPNLLMRGALAALGLAALLFAFKPALFAGVGACAGGIGTQVAYEVSHCTASPAKLFGFIGACCNWFLGLSAVYDAMRLGPEVVSLPQTIVMLGYSIIFARWAGWAVMPRNFVLAGSHMLNIAAQSNQLRRVLAYKLETEPNAKAEISALTAKATAGLAAAAAYVAAAPAMKAMMPVGSWLASAGGPFTIHPWPPLTKFFLSLTSLTDLQKPVEKISLTQYAALTLTGFIFTFYGLFVTPINYALTSVNVLLFLSSGWHLARKLKACMTKGECDVEDQYAGVN